MAHLKERIMKIIYRMVSMAEKPLIILKKLKYSGCFSGSQLQILEIKVY
jgi:hypothetical protein